MPLTRQDIEKYLNIFFDYNNKPELHCDKDEKGQFVKNADGKYTTTRKWSILDKNGNEIPRSAITVWEPLKKEDIFLNIYCHDSQGNVIDDLTIEEWHIQEITDTAVLLQDTKELNDDTNFVMIPLDKITKIEVGA